MIFPIQSKCGLSALLEEVFPKIWHLMYHKYHHFQLLKSICLKRGELASCGPFPLFFKTNEADERVQKTTKVDDCRVLSLVKKNPFITSTEVSTALEKVRCIITTRSLPDLPDTEGLTTTYSLLVTFKNREDRPIGRNKNGEGKEQLLIQSTSHYVSNMAEAE